MAFSSFSIICAQEKFKPGIYVSQGEQKGIELNINKDNTYELVLMSGELNVVNDTLKLKNKYANGDKFQVKEIKTETKSNGLLLRFSSKNIYYYATQVFVGTQKEDNSLVEYKSMKDLFEGKEYGYESDNLDVEIEKVKYVYLVLKQEGKITSSKYLINDKVSGLDIKSLTNGVANLELNAFYTDENTIAVSDGKQPIIFTLVNKDKEVVTESLKAIEIDDNAKITLPELEEQDYYATVEEVVDSAYAESNYAFKHSLNKTLNEALETLKKTPNKFLIITNDTDKKSFDDFIEMNETSLSYSMDYEYNEIYDSYNFYQASTKDKKWFDKDEKKPQIVIVNSLGNVLYRTTGTLKENEGLIHYYSELYNELTKANIRNKVDLVFQKSKKSSADIVAVFMGIQSLGRNYNDVYEVASVEAVEAVAEEVLEESYYGSETIKDSQNLYKLKTNKEVLIFNLKQLISEFDKSKKLDSDFLMVLKTELMNDGFNNRLFGDVFSSDNTELHYKISKYLVNNYTKINEFEKMQEPKDGDYKLKEAVVNFLNESANYELDTPLKNEITSLYKSFVVATDYDFNVTLGYFNVLKQVERVSNDFYGVFDTYFNTTFSNDYSVIEKLDDLYAENNEEYSWESYKSSFSNFLNEVAWSIVLDVDDVTLIKKAIKWSETSLKVTKKDGYYLDTLAQLYYKDGQKDKAIKTQKSALSAMKGEEDSSVYEEMQEVLDKMQNGTY